ncbi:MAG: substrate-binding domain-containing protein [bacterium]|nr:substrate-binding domain-containing protein [bacterium]
MLFLLAEVKLLTISGSYAMYPVIYEIKKSFEQRYNVKINLIAGGSGKGISDLISKSADIAMVARDPYDVEINKGVIPIKVYIDAVFIIVSAKNPAIEKLLKTPLNKKILEDIFITGRISKFSDLSIDLDKRINVYTRSDSAGSAQTLAKFLGKKQEDIIGVGIFSDTGIVDVISKDRYGISYANLPFIDFKNVKVIPFDINSNGIVDGFEVINSSADAKRLIRHGYPLSRYCYFFIRKDSGKIVKDFVRYVLIDSKKIIEKSQLTVPLSDNEILVEIEKIK